MGESDVRTKTICPTLVAACLLAAPAAANPTVFFGKLWLLSNVNGIPATFPRPAAVPDATFVTKHLSFFMNAPYDPDVNNSVGGFLNSANHVANLVFSNVVNSAVGGIVGIETPVVDSTAWACNSSYGVYMSFSGQIALTQGERITITHDDGVSLKIDDKAIGGLYSGQTSAIAQLFVFSGATGIHRMDLVYANICGDGLLSFSPAM